jgi:hypothetical protein
MLMTGEAKNKFFTKVAIAGVMLMSASVALSDAGAARGLDDPSLALGLANVNDWTTQLPFIDMAKFMRPWFASSEAQSGAMQYDALRAGGYLDANDWPTRIPDGMVRISTIWASVSASPEVTAPRAGTYVLSYEGQGEISLGGAVRTLRQEPGRIEFENVGGGQFWLSIEKTDPNGTGDYIRDISIVRPEHQALHEAGAIFNPDWLGLVEDARQVRFEGWISTTNSTMSEWSDRPKATDATWSGGVPVEIMVRLANEIGADPWFSLPHLATDEYMREFATYVRDHLDPKLKAHVEFSNEVWNFVFSQAHWTGERSRAEWGVDAPFEYHAKRATENALIWTEVFGAEAETRLVKVLGTQAANLGVTERLLNPVAWALHEPDAYVSPATVFDAIAPASYFGGAEVSETALRKALLAAIDDPAVDETAFLLARLRDPSYLWSVPYAAKMLAQQAEVADRFGLEMLAYEGGQHVHHSAFIPGLTEAEVAKLTEFLGAFVRSEAMATLYRDLWAAWREIGDGPFMQFVDVTEPSRWGSWGLFAHLDDSTPRSELLSDLNAATPAWWEDRGGEHFQQGVTTIGDATDQRLTGTSQEDFLVGGGGDDTLVGGRGDDGLHGGSGTDQVVLSGRSADYVIAADGTGWRVTGPDGTDRVVAVESFLFQDGTTLGLDAFVAQRGESDRGSVDEIAPHRFADGGAGFDRAVIALPDSGVMIQAIRPDSTLAAEVGPDAAFGYVAAERGRTATFDGALVKASTWSLQDNRATRGGAPLSDSTLETALAFGSVIVNYEEVEGGAFNDHFTGGGSSDRFYGVGGNDFLGGGAGADTLSGGEGRDTLNGGDGDDLIAGGTGNDRLTGGAGRDRFVFAVGDGSDRIADFEALDVLDLRESGAASAAALRSAAKASTGGVLLDLGGGDSVFLSGLGVADLGWVEFWI